MTAGSTKKFGAILLLALLSAGGGAGRAAADTGTLTLSGTMDGAIGSSLFSVTDFTAVASFSASNVLGCCGYSAYPAVFTFDISGVGTYTTAATPGVNAVVIGPPQVLGFGTYGLEIQDLGNAATAFYNAAANVELSPGVWGTLFSSPPLTDPFEESTALILPLAGGGTLTANFDSFDSTATLIVPEPSALVLLAVGLAATTTSRRSRRH